MAKKNNYGNGWLIAIAVIAAPFVLLWEKVGPFWFLVILGVPVFLWVRSKSQQNEQQEDKRIDAIVMPSESIVATVTTSKDAVANVEEYTLHEYCDKIEQAWQRGDYDWARMALQKIAYSMVGKHVNQEQKERFTQVMTEFSSEDPLYREVMAIALPYIMANPGTMQSKIYSHLPNWSEEEVRYVLYFANELGHIHRIKKGSSYKLMPPGNMIEGELSQSYIENDGNGGINVVYETQPEVIAEANGIAVSSQIFVRSRSNSRISVLHREATQLKDSGEWDKAIAALQEAQELMRKSDEIHTIERWLRLPIFLQQGGRFDEAMQEFNRLLDELNDRTADEFDHQPEFIQRGATYHQRAAIYNKMKVACKRQKLPEEAAKYEKLRDEYYAKHEEYMKERDDYMKQEHARFEARREERRANLAKLRDESESNS